MFRRYLMIVTIGLFIMLLAFPLAAQQESAPCDPTSDFGAQATAAYGAGDFAASLPAFACHLSTNPLDFDARTLYVQALIREGYTYTVYASAAFLDTLATERYNDMIASAEAALAADPNDEGAAAILVFANFPVDEVRNAAVDRLLAINPNSAIAHIWRASAASYYNNDQETALSELERALELAPDNAEIMAEAASIYLYGIGDLDTALTLINRALELKPNFAAVYADRSEYHVMLGDNDAALADLTRSIELNPSDYRNINRRGLLSVAQEDYPSAIADFVTVLAINPGSPTALSGLIDAALQTGDDGYRTLAAQSFQTARATIEDGAAVTPDSPTTITMTAGLLVRLPVTLTEGVEATMMMAAEDPTSLDPLIMVVDPNGGAVAWNDDIDLDTRNWNASVTITPALSGEYIVLATHSGSGTEGNATVSVAFGE